MAVMSSIGRCRKVCGDAFRLEVRAGRAHDLHAALLRQLGEKLDVAAEIHRARVDERPDAETAQLLHLIDRTRHRLGAHESAALARRDSSLETRPAHARE
jgi:hypothetical protein